LVIPAFVGEEDRRRPPGHPLGSLPSPEQRLELLPFFITQPYRILWTSHGHLLLLAMASIIPLTNL
jgi:hypothetical protein